MKEKFELNSFLFAANADFVEELYLNYIQNPESVDPYWQKYFSDIDRNKQMAKQSILGASWRPKKGKIISTDDLKNNDLKSVSQKIEQNDFAINLEEIKRVYRTYGHLSANLDPLGLEIIPENPYLSKLNLEFKDSKINLKETISKFEEIYCSDAGYEFEHVTTILEKDWLYAELEKMSSELLLTREDKIELLKDLIDLESFEEFIHNRFPGAKRFSIEGGESNIIACKQVIKTAGIENDVAEIIIGMAHRGRLNMLTKILGKDFAAMLAEFQGNIAHAESLNISGDVKYHLGRSSNFSLGDSKEIRLSLTANPSHLEAVNPVVVGKVRAKQDSVNDSKREKVAGLLIHGDAAFIGQGVVAETLCLANLDGYKTGGTIHIVINNQIGFTTPANQGKSGRYSTEFAKIIAAPIIHVNGNSVEKILLLSKLAEKYRYKFKKDIVLDIVCFRKYGHNEGDEPMFTQPLMYNKIKTIKTTAENYAELLDSQAIMSLGEAKLYKQKKLEFLDQKLNQAKQYKPTEEDWLKDKWSSLNKKDRVSESEEPTGISKDLIEKIAKALVNTPEGFNLNSKIQRLFEQKKKILQTGEGLDWAMAEALSYGSLLLEGSKIRLSGQDCKRGTFSHRHAVLFDQNNQQEYLSLNHIDKNQAKLEIINSSLSEYAVLGFEYGYSLVDPQTLTIWEAQFGDFANGAQIIIDQFIASAEEKWLRMSGLVLLLPHGYEGQGPEHSSARLERFLQLCAQDNMQVINCSTPANFFHAIRRQVHRKYRKPLVVMSPKSLLRNPLMISKLTELGEGTSFRSVIGETINLVDKIQVKKVIICSGKVFYDLYQAREKANIKDIALIRLDQFYPFPQAELANEISKYKNAEIIWCQEEPKNMGAWHFLESRLADTLQDIKHKYLRANYVGRPESASPSAGYLKMHNIEQELLINQALNINVSI